MTNLESKFQRVIEPLHQHYTFLHKTSIDVCEGYGNAGSTTTRTFGSPHNFSHTIYIDISEIRKAYRTSKFVARLGHFKSLSELIFVCLLHEIAHVKQNKSLGVIRVQAEARRIDYDGIAHDDSWLEQEADTWARKEFPKVKCLLK